MKLQYLGTGASEGMPSLFCNCNACAKARKAGGRNIRSRAQAIVDDRLLIDFGPDTYMHVTQYQVPLYAVQTCLITHAHADHLFASDFLRRKPVLAQVEANPLTVYGSAPTGACIAGIMNDSLVGRLEFSSVTPFVPFFAEGYRITPVKANHASELEPVNYLIEKDGAVLLYAHDTGYWGEETWHFFEAERPRLHLVSFDCTMGMFESRDSHMGLQTVLEMRDRLAKIGCIGSDTVCCVSHISHKAQMTHDEIAPIIKKEGILTAYDGMTVQF